MPGHTKGTLLVGFQVLPGEEMGGCLEMVPLLRPKDVGTYPGEFPRPA